MNKLITIDQFERKKHTKLTDNSDVIFILLNIMLERQWTDGYIFFQFHEWFLIYSTLIYR